MKILDARLFAGLAAAALALTAPQALGHGDVAPQAVDTSALPDIGEEWLIENPWRDPSTPEWATAIQIGDSGYNQNCARCHGLGAVSGGLAPDLRYLEADDYGDEWYLERYRNGATQNGITKMPAFGELLGQKAAWAIRTYIETRPDDGALDSYTPRLKVIRDRLKEMAEAVTDGEPPASFAAETEPMVQEMMDIASEIETGSGAPKADSIALQAALALDGSAESFTKASDTLTIGLSAAR